MAALAIARQTLAPAMDGRRAEPAPPAARPPTTRTSFVVRNRAELIAALGGDNATNATNATPKIIFVSGGIHGNVDDAGSALTCDDYADPAYPSRRSWPRTTRRSGAAPPGRPGRWRTPGSARPATRARGSTSTSDRTRRSSASRRQDRGHQPRPQTVSTTSSCATCASRTPTTASRPGTRPTARRATGTPSTTWCRSTAPPTSGSTTTRSATATTPTTPNRSTLDDRTRCTTARSTSSGRRTWSPSRTTTSSTTTRRCSIGSSNTVGADVGKLRVTIHHNRFANVGQRVPRVRFGQVDVYNNYFLRHRRGDLSVLVGCRRLLRDLRGEQLRAAQRGRSAGRLCLRLAGQRPRRDHRGRHAQSGGTGPLTPVSLVGEYNATHEPDLPPTDWVPTLRGRAPTRPRRCRPSSPPNAGRRQARHLIPLWRRGLASRTRGPGSTEHVRPARCRARRSSSYEVVKPAGVRCIHAESNGNGPWLTRWWSSPAATTRTSPAWKASQHRRFR